MLYCIPLDKLYTLSCLSLSGGWQRLRSNGQLISLGEQGCIPSAATDLVHKFRNDILLRSASGWIHSLGTGWLLYWGHGCSDEHYYGNCAATPFLQRGNKSHELTFFFPATLDVILKTDGKNKLSDCGISWLSLSVTPKPHEELQRD